MVLTVVGAELPLEIALLALDDAAVHYHEHARQEEQRPAGARQQGQPNKGQREGEVRRVACVPERPAAYQGSRRFAWIDRLPEKPINPWLHMKGDYVRSVGSGLAAVAALLAVLFLLGH